MTPLEITFERTLRRYVLGTLDEDARVRLEERLVNEPEIFDALGVVEDELIEDYLDDVLDEEEKRRLERHCLDAPGRERLPAFFRELRARAAGEAGPASAHWLGSLTPRPAWVAAAAAVLALSVAAHVWIALGPGLRPEAKAGVEAPTPASPDPRLAQLAAAREELVADLAAEREERERAETRLAELQAARAPQATPIPTFTLAAGLLRAAGSVPRVTVSPNATVVRLRLDLPADDYPSYRVVLRDANGEEIWSQSKLTAEETPDRILLSLLVPSSALAHGDYLMTLSGLTEGGEAEPVTSYPFRAVPP